VTVNGEQISLGARANPNEDTIKLDGNPIDAPQSYEYYAIYKPRGILSSTMSERSRKSVVDLIPTKTNIFPVGRLDVESEGLMLLTNDGNLANRLTHPKYQHEKEYRVLLARHPDNVQLETWRRGIVLDDGYQTQPVKVRIEKYQGKGIWLRVIMTEGRKRQIRQTAAQLGLPVVKLIRIRLSSLHLGNLEPGLFRELDEKEVKELKESTKLR
jgi:23S rRNA pseudouridine2605 synthase